MANSRYIKSKSYYTLRKKHKSLTDGVIYENDLMTLSPMDSLFSEEEYVLQDSNFKFSVRTGTNLQQKHKRGNWIENGICSGEMETVWTMECMGSGTTSDEGRIVLKPNYNSLKQFAYFGGAQTLVKASVNDIILNFPAELYFTNEDLYLTKTVFDSDPARTWEYVNVGTNMVKNDYAINIDVMDINEEDVYNPMRYFCLHWQDYEIINGSNHAAVTSWKVTAYTPDICENYQKVADVKINNISLEVWKDFNTGEKKIRCKSGGSVGMSIRPKQEIIDEYFANLDDFEKVLLDRDSNPKYTARLITPRETDTGFTYSMKNYTWPIVYGDYAPELESPAFDVYYKSLIWLAEYHDEWDSDNMWRSMTHEAIKNLDWTFIRHKGEEIEDLSHIDSSRIEPILKIWGRNFDDIKRFIDNIKYCNTVTYDGKNNIPDYFLTDVLELGGWETRVLHLHSDPNYMSDVLYSGMTLGYSSSDVDIEFFRRIKLNSHYLLRAKGTRASLESLFALFGMSASDYTINEEVAIAKGKSSYATGFAVEENNGPAVRYPLASEVAAINKSRNGYYGKHGYDDFGGIPVNAVTMSNGSQTTTYVIPWYDIETKYDGGLYYQMNGGWAKRITKPINLSITDVDSITSDGVLRFYDETESYLHFVDNIDGLRELATEDLKKNTVCYVTDITELASETANFDSLSHYFILNDETIPFLVSLAGTTGWKNIPESAIKNATGDGKRVVYLESIENDTKGNNPHKGNGQYDDGHEYLERMGEIFYYGLRNGEFSSYDADNCEKIKNYGFDIESGKTDNSKCWYFKDMSATDTNLRKVTISYDNNGRTVMTSDSISDSKFITGYQPFNPEDSNSDKVKDEAAANSIINVKNMEIEFNVDTIPSQFVEEYKEFVNNIVMFYAKQLIPTTTIFKYYFSDEQEIEPEPEPEPEEQIITFFLDGGKPDFGINGGTVRVMASAKGGVTVTIKAQTIDNDWIKITSDGIVTVLPAEEGSEGKTHTFSVTGTTPATSEYAAATAVTSYTITREARPQGKITPTIDVVQHEDVNVSPTDTSVSINITVTSNTEYTLTASTGTFNGNRLTISLQPTEESQVKETTVTVTGTTKPDDKYVGTASDTMRFKVIQSAKASIRISVVAERIGGSFASSGGSGTIVVTSVPSDYTWTAGPTASETWVHISSQKDGFTIDANNTYTARTATITGTATTNATEGYSQATAQLSYTINQLPLDLTQPKIISVSLSNMNFDYTGGSATITVVSDPTEYSWTTLSSNQNWIHISSDKNSFTVDANQSVGERTATITGTVKTDVKDGYDGQASSSVTYTIKQGSKPTRTITVVPTGTMYIEHSSFPAAFGDSVNFSLRGIGGQGTITYNCENVEDAAPNTYTTNGSITINFVSTESTQIELELVGMSFERAGHLYGVYGKFVDIDCHIGGGGTSVRDGSDKITINLDADDRDSTVYLDAGDGGTRTMVYDY